MDDALEKLLAGQALPEGLHHVVHEIDDDLLFLREPQLLLLQPVRPGTPLHAEPEHGQRTSRGTHEEEKHAWILERAAAGSSFKNHTKAAARRGPPMPGLRSPKTPGCTFYFCSTRLRRKASTS